jgi:hypothetical protein
VSAEPVRLLWERMEARDWEGVAAQLHPDVIVSEVRVVQDDQRFFAASFFEVSDGKIVSGVEYWSDGEPSPAPEWRAQWMEPL